MTVTYLLNRATEADLAEHLRQCDADFVPPLSGRVELQAYVRKIASKATRFEAWSGVTLVGLVAAYCNDHEKRVAHITNVSVLRQWMGKGIAGNLISECVEHAKALGMLQINLEVDSENAFAIKLYENRGFVKGKMDAGSLAMNLSLTKVERA